nr:acyl-CoA dehydrogenase family protein [Streptomyces sp. HNM0574]
MAVSSPLPPPLYAGSGRDGYEPGPREDAGDWARTARELADDLAADAADRDRAGAPPHDEAARLREAGLLGLLTPPVAGLRGRGSGWRTAAAVVREIAAADGSAGELLARHHVLSWCPRLFGPGGEGDPALEARSAREGRLWGGRFAPDPGDGVTATPAGKKYRLGGRLWCPSGVGVADVLVVCARCARTGETLVLRVDPRRPGVVTEPAAGRIGQRLTGAGTVGFDDVRVDARQVLGRVPGDEHLRSPFTALAPLAQRLMLTHVALGIAEGALAEARDISRTGSGRPPVPDYGHGEARWLSGADPYVLLAYGELVTAARAAACVVDDATEALARGVAAGPELDADERAGIAVLVTAAEAVTTDAVLRVTARVMELTDSAPAAGCDRFWRDARVLTTRTTSAHGLRDIGDHYLHGSHPPLG